MSRPRPPAQLVLGVGDGMALGYRAGAALNDMEFVHDHSTRLPFGGILTTQAGRAEAGYLLNTAGTPLRQEAG